jgi:hypothetical protein
MPIPSDTAVSLMVIRGPVMVARTIPVRRSSVLTRPFLTQEKINSNKNNALQPLINKYFGKRV